MKLIKRKKRLLFASVDIGYRIDHYTSFITMELKEQIEVESFSKFKLPDSHYKTNYTYYCPIDKKSKIYVWCYILLFFIRALFRYDVFHFFSGETILTRKLRRFELATYRFFGKKVIMHFVGSDIRSEKYLIEKNENLFEFLKGKYIFKEPLSEKFQLKLIADAKKYANKIFVSTPDLLEILPEAIYLPVLIDLSKSDYDLQKLNTSKLKSNKIISIFHSPSSISNKGSHHIHMTLTKLKMEFGDKINIITPASKSNKNKNYPSSRYEMFEYMKLSNIVIDQMVIGWYGLKSLESLAFGNKVICYIDQMYLNYLPKQSPIINADIISLEEILRTEILNLLDNENSQEIFQTNRLYLEKNHSFNVIKDQLIESWIS
jgi:hypothetical protein